MSSSDSEDDCYGHVARKLQTMKNRYHEDTLESTNLLNDSQEIDEVLKNSTVDLTKVKQTSFVAEELPNKHSSGYLDVSKEADGVVAGSRLTRSSARRRAEAIVTLDCNTPDSAMCDGLAPLIENNRGRGRGRGRGRKSRSGRTSNDTPAGTTSITTRGRKRRGNTRRSINNLLGNLEVFYPTYSVGNTDEYPDQSNNQALFSNRRSEDVVIIDDNEIMEENEELSVKVYWQSAEIFKFTIRRFQKIVQIFDYFSQKENVSHSKLLFTYNDKILKPDDTPDSMKYSIVKFIDGGIVNQNVTALMTNNSDGNIRNGVKIKFQCQNVKKPFEITVGLDDKLSVAMMKFAEHLEKTIDKLKFEFDGDSISGKQTPHDLEFEGGECIDVKIIS